MSLSTAVGHLQDGIRSSKGVVRALVEAAPLFAARSLHGHPHLALQFDGGIGDELLCSAPLRELKRRNHGPLWVITRYPELFQRNPDVTAVTRADLRGVNRFVHVFKVPHVRLAYATHVGGRDIPPKEHVITVLCRAVGIRGEIWKKPYLHLAASEVRAGRIAPSLIAIQTSGLSAKYPALTKEWFPDRFQAVADHFSRTCQLVQLGSSKDPLLHGVLDLRGKTSIRQTAAVLRGCQLFIGLAGFLQHLARSVDCRSVIIYGGRELPSQTGYPCNANVTTSPECSPCWIYRDCMHEFKCMRQVDVATVIRAVDRQLQSRSRPLEVESETL